MDSRPCDYGGQAFRGPSGSLAARGGRGTVLSALFQGAAREESDGGRMPGVAVWIWRREARRKRRD